MFALSSNSSAAYTTVNRDPFARVSLVRETVKTADSCDWCGSTRKSGKLFAYGTDTDGGRLFKHPGKFCSKSCHDAYHNIR